MSEWKKIQLATITEYTINTDYRQGVYATVHVNIQYMEGA